MEVLKMSVNVKKIIKKATKKYKKKVSLRYSSKVFKEVKNLFAEEYLSDDTLEVVIQAVIDELYELSLSEVCDRDGIDNIITSDLGCSLGEIVEQHKGRC